MPKNIPVALLAVFATISLSAPLAAQGRSTASSATLEAAAAARPTNSRAVVTAAMASPQAIATAKTLGVSSGELNARAAALDDASVQQLADRILAGGSSNIVISTTVVIIVLLVLILLTR